MVEYIAQTVKFPSNCNYSLTLITVYNSSPNIPDKKLVLFDKNDFSKNINGHFGDYLRGVSSFSEQLSANGIMADLTNLNDFQLNVLNNFIFEKRKVFFSEKNTSGPKNIVDAINVIL